MIISCPSCAKKFEVDANLIPENGRLLKCGTCSHTWFFINNKFKDNIDLNINPIQASINEENIKKPSEKKLKKTKKTYIDLSNKKSNLQSKKGSELIKYEKKSTFSFGKILSFLIVIIITFIAIIIILDTFKNPLSILFPNIEILLYNLFETLRDLMLFAKDLK
ncbi:zinc-ribbon domain-containing protein [Candidatus Pelagibacter sp.]|nr:zinc-ribbon domain-containing protein [Candidatus Pelagibacter sp.]